MLRRFPIAPDLRARVERGVPVPPAEPVTAATVMLVREAATAAGSRPGLGADASGDGVEVWLLRRADGLPSAPGVTAFPGGGLDERDADPDVPWRGAPVEGWGRRLGLADEDAAALLCAAVRETYEESGVLLAEVAGAQPDAAGSGVVGSGAAGSGGVGLPAGREDAERAALARREVALSELLRRRGLALRSDLLRPWARWTTPEPAERRHDTWFFLAAVPSAARARHVGEDGHASEAVEGRWWRPSEVLDAEARGQVRLLPPTRVALEELAAAPDLAALLGTRRSLAAVLPRVAGAPDDLHLLADLPEHPDPVGSV
ncbi:NUDIX hydrolase [Pseudokineococcus sp. 1T1Z-3]|uniref:NUDIX hydrolase n=1 Tax=Pseudokineococcus sp. 1T1Z-3 TaxID=3132745 RepID=UPI003095E3BC